MTELPVAEDHSSSEMTDLATSTSTSATADPPVLATASSSWSSPKATSGSPKVTSGSPSAKGFLASEPLLSDPLARASRNLDEEGYREVSGVAVASLVMGLVALSLLFLVRAFHPVAYAVVPLLGCGLAMRGWWLIRTSEGELTGELFAGWGAGLSAFALAAGWGWQAYEYATEVPEGFQRIHYRQLALDQLEGATQQMPQEVLELDQESVFIKGYIYPGDKTAGIREFILCRDKGDCCFGGQPPPWDMIHVTLKKDVPTLNYNLSQFKVFGQFRIQQGQALHDLGAVLYHIDEAEFRQ